ncbi:MAG TPA: hypothetical protein VN253_10550 [Kofleriaceae bacterium]|nr:hypothetical protein [Kofleriaceae bacterium]
MALSPALIAAWVAEIVARRRFVRIGATRRAFERLRLHELLDGRTIETQLLGTGKSNAVVAVRLIGRGAPKTCSSSVLSHATSGARRSLPTGQVRSVQPS